jgi:pimeloyl-ACP methyl ester carboxylesterase
MVDVDGYRLSARRVGRGAPPVVLEAGVGGDSGVWRAVWSRNARFTRVCRYDRAGRGRSDPGLRPSSFGAHAEELRTLLGRLGVSAPRVLVGLGLGAAVATEYARRFPARSPGWCSSRRGLGYDRARGCP